MLSSPGEPSSFCDLACSALICKLQHTGAKLLVNLVNASETLLGVMPEPYTLTRLEFPDEEKPMEETWHVKVPRE